MVCVTWYVATKGWGAPLFIQIVVCIIYLGYDVDYTNYLHYASQGKGQFLNNFISPNQQQLPSKMAFVGQNRLVLPKGLETFTRVGDFAVEDARVEMYSSIASIGTQVDEL